jgi:predicted membrane-bound mannosyltransferase
LQGIPDSIIAYKVYFERAGHGRQGLHIHPWFYYLKMLLFSKYHGGRIWSEALVLVLGLFGVSAAFRKKSRLEGDRGFVRFLAFYTIVMTAVYSILPYKTPWNMLSFLHGWILLAGIGMLELVKYLTFGWRRIAVTMAVTFAFLHFSWQSVLGNFRYYEDSTNPYVYAHPISDVYMIVDKIRAYAEVDDAGRDIYIEVICPGDDYWPLPWYLRDFPNIGWWNRVDEKAPAAPMIIASPAVEAAVIRKLYELPPPGKKTLYLPLFDDYLELRPNVELRGYVSKDLWDKHYLRQVSLQE